MIFRKNRDSEVIEAAKKGKIVTIQMLLNNNSDINVKDPEGMTPLMWAARRGYKSIVKSLLINGANPNLQDIHGWSAMDWAIGRGYFGIVRLFKKLMR